MERTLLSIVPALVGWRVLGERGRHVGHLHLSKRAALDEARYAAEHSGPALIQVLHRDGTIEDELTYPDDVSDLRRITASWPSPRISGEQPTSMR
jgi:hypothetical protein